jgi:hypothetical protein
MMPVDPHTLAQQMRDQLTVSEEQLRAKTQEKIALDQIGKAKQALLATDIDRLPELCFSAGEIERRRSLLAMQRDGEGRFYQSQIDLCTLVINQLNRQIEQLKASLEQLESRVIRPS